MRIDPPMSLPVANGANPAASAAPDPPDDPPGVNAVFHGLRVTPHSLVWQKPAQLNSGVEVRMWMTPPASWIRSMIGWSYLAISSAERDRALLPRTPDHRLLLLGRDAQTLEWSRRVALAEIALRGGFSFCPRLVVASIDHCVEHRIVRLDLVDQRLEMLQR